MKQPVKKSTNDSFASFSGATSDNGSIIGDIKIHGGVIASIVKEALREIPGVSRLSGSGIDGVAVVSAIFGAEDICAAASNLRGALSRLDL